MVVRCAAVWSRLARAWHLLGFRMHGDQVDGESVKPVPVPLVGPAPLVGQDVVVDVRFAEGIPGVDEFADRCPERHVAE